MEFIIEAYDKKDRVGVENICKETAAPFFQKKKLIEAVPLMFMSYFLDHEPSLCLIGKDKSGSVAGYVLSSIAPYEEYKKMMKKEYYPQMKKLSFISPLIFDSVLAIIKNDEGMQAQMHIDISPAYQGQGLGSRLIKELQDVLKKAGKNSVDVTGIEKSGRNLNFYLRNGFKIIREYKGQVDLRLSF
ncbi:MAG: GNAT family N-acetyltransferase [Bacilli bacterium]|jgi:ribosomal protein S18 acetylase RimI-like enzyme|nr:GNAT family N-acetyltransferase [Bacilli bacterium]